MSKFERALAFASEKHCGMKRKLDGAPYMLHPIEVALIVSTMTYDDEVLAACALHDVVEDTDTGPEEVESRFGQRVAALVASETEDKRPGTPKSESWRSRKEESLEKLKNAEDIGVKYLWLGDKLSNLRSMHKAFLAEGNDLFLEFNQKDPAQHAWYYRSVLALLSELCEHDAWKELSALTDAVFGKDNGDEPEV